jgi:hypothetical protein
MAPKTTVTIFQNMTMLAMPTAKQRIMLMTPALLLLAAACQVASRNPPLGVYAWRRSVCV